jgi:hypothetical protein
MGAEIAFVVYLGWKVLGGEMGPEVEVRGDRLTVGLVGSACVSQCENILRGEGDGVLIVYSVNESIQKRLPFICVGSKV